MPFPRASGLGRKLILLSLGVAFPALLSGCANVPHTTVLPKTDAARMIQDLYVLIFWLAVVVFIGVQGGLLYVLWRFRARPGHELPEQTHGNTTLEIGWTIAPAVILVIMAVPTIQTIFALESAPPPSPDGGPPLVVEVVGKQWWWEFRYPEVTLANGQPLTTANEMVIPTGRTVYLHISSDNVIHSFWVQQLMGKIDAMPNHDNRIWFTAEDPGQYFGQCAEYCGVQHAQMRMNVIAMTPTDYQAWVAQTSQTDVPSEGSIFDQGAQAFNANGCAGCHTIEGNPTAVGKIGPNLTNFGSRTTLAAGILPNTPENLAAWIQDPQAVKPGNFMPNLHVRPQEVEALVAYIHSLK
jgi:cytochrome c oxidase subunit II